MPRSFQLVSAIAIAVAVGVSAQGGTQPQAQNPPGMAEMSVIHELFMSHARITRTVTNLPDGVRTVTASDDPRVAQLLKGHVARMDVLVDTGRDPNLPMESPALRTLFRKFETIKTSSEVTATGVVVTQTSSDPETVQALRQHASEVTNFVDQGMAAMHDAMMKRAPWNTTGHLLSRHRLLGRLLPVRNAAPDGHAE